MKTIFITIFEGIEAKHILRTKVLPTLLLDKNIKIVLLAKSVERVEYYKKEFHDERIVYEVVPYERTLGEGFDRVFAYLKFLMLRTGTVKLRRKMSYELTGNIFTFVLNSFLNMIFAHRVVRVVARRLDMLLVKNDTYTEIFDKYNPSLVFCAHLFEEPETHLLREAKKRNIRTIGLVNSWDKVTARAVMRLLPDKIIVFNDIVKCEMVKYNDIKEKHIFVSGLPQYDMYFNRSEPYSTREDFFKKIHIDPKNKLIVYAPMGRTFSNIDWDVYDILEKMNKNGEFGENVSILVRFQPNDFIDEGEIQRRPNLKYDYPGKRFTATRGVDWDMNESDIRHLYDTLFYLDVVVCWAGSFGIDAVIFGKPVVHPNLPLRIDEPRMNSPREHYTFTHYKKALGSGGLKLAGTEEELKNAIKSYLDDPSIDREGRKRLITEEVQFTDGKSGERIAQFVLQHLNG